MKPLAIKLFTLLALMMPMLLWASEPDENGVPFNGLILDKYGQPLKGVRVYLHSEGYAARSDKKGRFGLTDVLPNDTLHLKYHRRLYLVPVEGRKGIRIFLSDEVDPVAQLDQELVDMGYGFVKRREVIQPSNGISGEDLIRSGYTSLLQALQGRLPGLNISVSGIPGDQGTVRMRGTNSLMLDQTPLFVVDDIVVPSLEFLNLYDVDYVEVLKDASIYGSRGANGAILVRTKRGKK